MSRLTARELRSFHAGDEALFRRLVEEYTPRLLALARSYAEDSDAARDLVQETWARAYARRETYTARGTLLGWLYAVCRNVCRGTLRELSGREAMIRDAGSFVDNSPAAPDDELDRAERRRSVRRAIGELPDRQRDVLVLRLLEGLSVRETAAELGCAEGTVKASLNQALRNLRKSMEGYP